MIGMEFMKQKNIRIQYRDIYFLQGIIYFYSLALYFLLYAQLLKRLYASFPGESRYHRASLGLSIKKSQEQVQNRGYHSKGNFLLQINCNFSIPVFLFSLYYTVRAMGNQSCNYCPSSKLEKPKLHSLEFSPEIQNLIDSIRQESKKQFIDIKEYKLQNGKFFRGNYANHSRSGYGEYYDHKNAYFGHFFNNLPHGRGLLIKSFEDFIQGQFMQGRPFGKINERINNKYFHGIYDQDGKVQGVLKTSSYQYQGAFKNNKFNGFGKLILSNGDKYVGMFQQGKYHGEGQYTTSNQQHYKGQFRNGGYEGKGVYTWREGYFYEGEYRKGQRNGLGKFLRGKQVYEGFWKNGQPYTKKEKLEEKQEIKAI